MGLYLASVTVNQACLAQGQVRRAAARWITCAAFFIAWNFAAAIVGNEFRRVEIGFALTAGVLFACSTSSTAAPTGGPRTSREGLDRGARAAARARSTRTT